jgi:hypothetical protein
VPSQQVLLPPGPDGMLWQNVEYHRYGNNPLETHLFQIPATFKIHEPPFTVHDTSDLKLVYRTNKNFLEE